MWCIYNGILLGFKKEGNPVIGYNMDKTLGHFIKWNEPVTKRQILYDSIYIKVSKLLKLIETESRMVVTRDLGEGERGVVV